MAYKITTDCVSCGSCQIECPNKAIVEGECTYKVDPKRCTECIGYYAKPRCEEVCPMDACVPDEKHKESDSDLRAKWGKIDSWPLVSIYQRGGTKTASQKS